MYPESLCDRLISVASVLNGALALVSGRTLADIDALPFTRGFACAAEHGAIMRYADGKTRHAECTLPEDWWTRAQDAMTGWPGAWIEKKSCGFAFHYRQSPEHAPEMRALAEAMVAEDERFETMPGHNVVEVRRRGLNKGAAVEVFMARPPFAGRIPVFVGDDVTDEDGFRAATAMGGLGLHVERDFSGKTENVRDWLSCFSASK